MNAGGILSVVVVVCFGMNLDWNRTNLVFGRICLHVLFFECLV